MSDERRRHGWSSGEIRDKIPVIGALQDEVLGIANLVNAWGPLHEGEIIGPDDMTKQINEMFIGKIYPLAHQYTGALGKTVGLQGEKLGVTDAINTSAEDVNTDEGGSWNNSGKHG